MTDLPSTLGQLRDSGYTSQSVKDEMRGNLLSRLASGEELFPGILGFDETVIPQVQNAILSRHDMLFLGLRGQGRDHHGGGGGEDGGKAHGEAPGGWLDVPRI